MIYMWHNQFFENNNTTDSTYFNGCKAIMQDEITRFTFFLTPWTVFKEMRICYLIQVLLIGTILTSVIVLKECEDKGGKKILCVLFSNIYSLFLFNEKFVNGILYLAMLEEW